MKSHPRIRKTIKWGGAAVTVLLSVIWIASVFLRCEVRFAGGVWVGTGLGNVEIASDEFATGGAGMDLGVIKPNWTRNWFWWPSPLPYGSGTSGWCIPLWIPVTIAFFPTAAACRLDTLARSREREHLCPKCNYDRTGILKVAKCPECGAAPASV